MYGRDGDRDALMVQMPPYMHTMFFCDKTLDFLADNKTFAALLNSLLVSHFQVIFWL